MLTAKQIRILRCLEAQIEVELTESVGDAARGVEYQDGLIRVIQMIDEFINWGDSDMSGSEASAYENWEINK